MAINGKSAAPAVAPLLKNAAAAPVVYFDQVPVFGTYGGLIEVELAARLLMPKADGSVGTDMSCTAHLRCSPQAMMMLVDAGTKGLQMFAKQQQAQQEQQEQPFENSEQRSSLLTN